MKRFNRSILVKLIFTFITVGLILSFALIVVQSRMFLHVLYEQQDLAMQDTARYAVEYVDSLLREVKNACIQLSYIPELNSGDRDAIGKSLQAYIEQSRQCFRRTYYVDANRRMYSSVEVALEVLQKTMNYDIPLQLADATPANGNAALSDLYRSSMITANTIAVSRRNALGGTAIAELDLNEVEKHILNALGASEVDYVLTTGTGNVICRRLPGNVSETEILARCNTENEHRIAFSANGGAPFRLYTARAFRQSNWKLYFILDESSVYDSLWQLIRYTVGISALLMFAMVMILSTVASHFVNPIRRLSAHLKEINGEDGYGQFKPLKREDEVGELSENIGSMLKRIDIITRKQTAEQQQRFDAELHVLQNQLNPHFLYNSLNMLSALAIQGRSDQIPPAVSALVHILLMGTDKVGPAVTLNEELRSTQEYMRIMRLRYGDRFELNVSAPEELRACYVPKLILQPIIENSVFHGMSTIEDGGLIFIEATLDKDVLMVNVTDNGCGMNTEKTAALLDNHQSGEIKSTGLINTDARIRLYFGEGYGLTVNSALGVGTHVSVRLKLIKTMEEWEEIVHENRA